MKIKARLFSIMLPHGIVGAAGPMRTRNRSEGHEPKIEAVPL